MADDAFRLLNTLQIVSPVVFTGTGNLLMGNNGVAFIKKGTGAATQVTLRARAIRGMFTFVKDAKGDAGTNNITVVPDGTTNNTTIDGAASFVMAENYAGAIFGHNGSEWSVIAYFNNLTDASLNLLSGIAATATEINSVAQTSARLVDVTSATLAVTQASHANRTILLDSTHTQAATLPQATGTGAVYTFVVKTLGTDGSKVIQVGNSTDVIQGVAFVANTQNTTDNFLTSATSDTITFNNTTQGGLVGATVEIEDIAVGVFTVRSHTGTTGNPATPFSAAV